MLLNEEGQPVEAGEIGKLCFKNEFGQLQCELGVSAAELSLVEKRFKISRNEFFIAAVLVHADGAEHITVKGLRDEVQKNHFFFRKFISVFTKKPR